MKAGLTLPQVSSTNKKGRVSPNHYKIKGRIKRKYEVAIILPTYCEAENIEKLIESIENLNLDSLILVIDDSSPDGTQKRVEELQRKYSNILLMIRPSKMGLGTAITDAFNFLLSLKHKPKYVITMDADFSHNPEDIPRLLSLAKRGYDLVVGSRYCPGGKTKKWSPIRILISKIANIFASTILNTKISDCTSGFRCYSRRFLQKVIGSLHSQTYEIQIETVRQAVKGGFFVAEIPITFVNRKMGKSKLTPNEVMHFISYTMKANLEDYIISSVFKLVMLRQKNRFLYEKMSLFNQSFLNYVENTKKLI